MTTAGRPTWSPAIGGSSLRERGVDFGVVSTKDVVKEAKLKLRKDLFGEEEDHESVNKEHNSQKHRKSKDFRKKTRRTVRSHDGVHSNAHLIDKDDPDDDSGQRLNNEDVEAELNKQNEQKELTENESNSSDSDKDEEEGHKEEEEEEEEDEESEDDEEQELLKELERVREERRMAKLVEEQRQLEEEERLEYERMMTSNPLLNMDGIENDKIGTIETKRKRRWDDDVIFKNQANDDPFNSNKDKKQRFINDPLRSDMCRRFLKKYVH